MKSSKKQTYCMMGIAMLVIAGILLYIALSQPRVYSNDNASNASIQVVQQIDGTYVSADTVINATNVSIVYPLNINTATVDELKTIDGLGEVRAAQIVAYREDNGSFNSVEEIKNIKGIGDNVYNQAAPYLTV